MVEIKPFCTRPFEEIEIHPAGDVYTCCPNWNKFYSIGNIYKNSIDEIWNSKNAQEVRKRILNNDYSLCDINACTYCSQSLFTSPYNTKCTPIMEEYPIIVKFCYDYECNIACSICRDGIKRLSDEKLEELNSKIETFFLPFLKSAKTLIINSHGDPFGSRHSRLVIQKAAKIYPNLKFDFHTNGLLCNEASFKNLNITPDRIEKIRISIHAATAQTYGKIVQNGEIYFPKLIENLKYIAKIREKNPFALYVHFVITKLNYKEMPAFVRLAQEFGAIPCFWEFRQENCAYQNTDNHYVFNPNHPLHQDFLEVLKDPILLTYKENITPVILDLILKQQNFH